MTSKILLLNLVGTQKKVEYIPNFVTKNNQKKKINNGSLKIILCLARFHRNKGIDVLLKAMTYLSGYILWIVGEGSERKLYDLIIKNMILKIKFFFMNGQIISRSF